jgi:hypothetical protein
MEAFIESFDYDPILFESGDIPFHHDMTLADACFNEVQNSHMFILIIGGRYGSSAEEHKKTLSSDELQRMYEAYNSVTKKEYETARIKDIPIFIFVDKNVKAEYETFKSNRDNDTIKYAHVDSVNIFRLLDDILFQKRNNFVREFDKFEDITSWLREQWAGIFCDLLTRKREDITLKDMSSRILELNNVTSSLKEYTQSILMRVNPESKPIIDREESKERNAKIVRFRREPMIKYIRDEAKSITGLENPIPTVKLFNAVERALTFEQFLEIAGLPPKLKEELRGPFRSQANKDFMGLKQQYFNVVLDGGDDADKEAADANGPDSES